MAPIPAIRSPPTRKGTPVACKAWKENLRTACLNRARRLSTPRTAENASLCVEDVQPVRLLVENEMIEQGVLLMSSSWDAQYPNTTPSLSLVDTVDMENGTSEEVPAIRRTPNAHHFISEEELFALLEEVEAELEKQETQQVEDALVFAQSDELDLIERIADYQEWEATRTESNEYVSCPLCCEAHLLQMFPDRRIVCPNHMDESCLLDLSNSLQFSLDDLKERLRVVYEQHAMRCGGNLVFQILTDSSTDDRMVVSRENVLFAVCRNCQTNMSIA
jgi:hypothetical protein